jgi:nucleotide-binding universal stress UspA family protein
MSEYTRILCAVDMAVSSRRVLDCALWWARWHGAGVSVVHVNAAPPEGIALDVFATDSALIATGVGTGAGAVASARALDTAGRDDQLDRLEAFTRQGRIEGLQVEAILEDDLSVPDAIIARANALAADLIVIGAGHEATADAHPTLGSVTSRVLRSAACSVLVIPAPGADAATPYVKGLHRICCAVDFSDASSDALAAAVELSEAAPAHLSVVHVVERVSEVAGLASDVDQRREARIQPACDQLDALVGQIAGPVRPVEEIVADGDAAVEILKLAYEGDADLLVLPTARQPGAPARAAAIVDAVAGGARCPVLVAAREDGSGLGLPQPIGADGSRPSRDNHG